MFQGGSFSSLLFAMLLLTMILRKEDVRFRFSESMEKVNNFDLKLYKRDEPGLERLVGIVKGFSDDIEMLFV